MILLLLALISGCAPRGPLPAETSRIPTGRDIESKLGREIHDDILTYYGRYEDDALQGYVQRIGEQIAAVSEQADLIFRFTILDTPEVNAFTLPGGYVYVHRGLLAYLGTEAELAAVLAHEIGHSVGRHAMVRLETASLPNPKDTRRSVTPPPFRSNAANSLFNSAGDAFVNGFGREPEIEATQHASRYLARAGYDPSILATVLVPLRHQHRMESALAQKDNRPSSSYHVVRALLNEPETTFAATIATTGPPTVRIAQVIKQEEFLEKLDGLTFSDSARFGIRRGSRVYHQELGVSFVFPQDWSLENQRTGWRAIAPKGDAFIQVAYQELDVALTPKEFIAQRLQLDTQSSAREFMAGTVPGFSVVTIVDSPFGTRPSRFYVVVLGSRAFIFVSVAQSDPIHTLYDTAFEQTASSLHALSAEEEVLARPLRLKIVNATEGMGYRRLAEASPLRTAVEDQLRVLNHADPDGAIYPGQLIKIIE